MPASTTVSATFRSSRSATAAIDWFLNQAIDRDAVSVAVMAPGEQQRPPRAGDNRRADLTWIVTIDADRAQLGARSIVETLKREGGTISRNR